MTLFISFIFGAALFYLFPFFPFSVCGLFLLASSFAAFRKKFLLIAVIAAGALYAMLRFSPAADSLDVWNKELRVTGRFAPRINAPSVRADIDTFIIDDAVDEESGEEIEELGGKEVNLISDFDPDADEAYELLLKTGKDRTRLNPGGMKSSKLYASVLAADEERKMPWSPADQFNRYRNDLNTFVLNRFQGDAGALVAAVTTGEMSFLSDDIKNAFGTTGLAHILSISGTHFGLFSVMLFTTFVFFIKRLPYHALQRLTVYLTPKQAAAVLCIPFMLMYLGISGGSVPAVRSFIMIGLSLTGLLIGRKGYWLNSLLFAAFIIVAWHPEALLSISFQLSFLAVLFIGVIIDRTGEEKGEQDEEPQENRTVRFLKSSIRISLAASLGTAPLVAYNFHYFSLISPIANLIATPLIGSVLVVLALVSSFIFLATGSYLLAPLVGWCAELSIYTVRLMSRIPYADIKVPAFPVYLCVFFYLCCLVWFAAGRKKLLLYAAVLPLLAYALATVAEKKGLSVTFLDVGQGDSAVIELPDRRTIVVDTGRTGRETASYLGYTGKRDIQALVLTHVHPDHTGGMQHIMDRFRVKQLWDNGLLRYPEAMNIKAKRKALARGDLISAGSSTLTVLHPYQGFHTLYGSEYDEENNSSLVLKVSGRNSSFLFAGDIEQEAEEDMLHLGRALRSDVIKIPHHGSKTSTDESFLYEVSPSVAVISVGRDNPFGHPREEVLERLKGRNVLRTDLDGVIKITETEAGLEIKKYKDFVLGKADGFEMEFGNIKKLFHTW